MSPEKNKYTQIIEVVFQNHWKKSAREVTFTREEFAIAAKKLGISLPKNLGDIIYTFRYRADLPESISVKANIGKQWIIRPAGKGIYKFVQVDEFNLEPAKQMTVTKIPDSTPGIIEKYALSDEQALLAKIRYNRLIDIFSGLTCFSLQSHLRTSVPDLGQLETDELYIGIDKSGVHYVIPVQAKGGKDRLGIVQIEQDVSFCKWKFPSLVCTPIAAQFLQGNTIALFQLEVLPKGIKVSAEKHYQLVSPDRLSDEELATYKARFA